MYSLTVRDHIMVAHSFRGEVFGPAQKLHGATYTIDVEVSAHNLDKNGLVIDIAVLSSTLADVLDGWRYSNLDELPEFAGRNTTTEFLAHALHGRLASRLKALVGAHEIGVMPAGLKVTLAESHVAWASYQGPL